mmetsp:Transcript_7296/g.13326  ORF Transcript_7296/g.13326 Transcript_7296/m.13326 type:complete len:391 (+) Transcript_7296:113-1285(+)
MMNPHAYGDPRRMDPRLFMRMQQQPPQQQQHHEPRQHHHPQQTGYGPPLPPPPPPPTQPRKQGDDQEVALNLLQLKSNPENSGASEAELQMQAQRQAAMMHGRGGNGGRMYPAVGSVYGYPTAGFDRQMLAGAPVERAHAAPPLMDEGIVLTDVSFDDLVGDSDLVVLKDRDLVPDALFVAMAQMKPCKLTQADRVGCYKTREIGFVGMCCKHCGGQPGFGRYFPNSVRSLAQTTTSQTILKHIGGKCRFCPPTIRKAVLELQRQQAHKEGMATGRPRYGSRKIFFQRMWARLHGKSQPEEEPTGEHSDETKENTSDHAPVTTPNGMSAEEAAASSSDADENQNAATEGINGEAGTSPRKRKLEDEDIINKEGPVEEGLDSSKKTKVVPI